MDIAVRKRGRQRDDLGPKSKHQSLHLWEYYSSKNQQPFNQVAVGDGKQYLWHATHDGTQCGHLRLRTTAALIQSELKTLQCEQCAIRCDKYCIKHSPAVHAALFYINKFKPATDTILTNDKVLRGKYGGADFYLPGINLAVEVDGEQHHDRDYKSTTLETQMDRDNRKDQQYTAAGVRLLRPQPTAYSLQPLKGRGACDVPGSVVAFHAA
jgi:hypothetical protein